MRARGVLRVKKCARRVFSWQNNTRAGRSRGESMRALGVLGANKCTLAALSERKMIAREIMWANTCARHMGGSVWPPDLTLFARLFVMQLAKDFCCFSLMKTAMTCLILNIQSVKSLHIINVERFVGFQHVTDMLICELGREPSNGAAWRQTC